MLCITSKTLRFHRVQTSIALLAAAVVFAASGAVAGAKEQLPETSYDGMTLVKSTKTSFVYRKPAADFAQYDKIQILKCQVAFKKDWAKEYNRAQGASVGSTRVTEADMKRIKAAVSELFDEVFTREFAKSGQYTIVSEPNANTLLLRPAVINLDVTAPVIDPAVRTKASSAGEGTLLLEIYDGLSGEILARIVDRRRDPDRPYGQWATRAFNKAAAERIMKQWAGQLREAFDEAHEGKVRQKLSEQDDG
jgi:hypothetical protein